MPIRTPTLTMMKRRSPRRKSPKRRKMKMRRTLSLASLKKSTRSMKSTNSERKEPRCTMRSKTS
jgi:hypothetical protein